MYARKLPTHTYDRTRRSKNDILVYSENELRKVLGNVERGTRVVITSEIFITKPIEVKIAEKVTSLVDAQDVIIAGFGGGGLTRKQNVDEPFDLFHIGNSNATLAFNDPVGVHLQNLNFNGFVHIVYLPVNTPVAGVENQTYLKGLKITDCVLQNSHAMIGSAAFSNPNIVGTIWGLDMSNNTMYSKLDGVDRNCSLVDPSYSPAYGTVWIIDGIISGNQSLDENGTTASYSEEHSLDCRMTSTDVVNNYLSGTIDIQTYKDVKIESNSCHRIKLDTFLSPVETNPNHAQIINNFIEDTLVIHLVGSLISGNYVKGAVTNDVNSKNLRVTDNHFETLSPPNVFPNGECCIVRNNYGGDNGILTPSRDVDAYGRIPIAGEILGETVIDTDNASGTPWVWSTSSIIFAQVVPVSVKFWVPCGSKVLVRLHCHIRDITDPALPVLDEGEIQIQPAVGAPFGASVCNDRQQFTLDETGFQPMTFEWYLDFSVGGAGAYQNADGSITINFFARVTGIGQTIEFRAGSQYPVVANPINAGPLTVMVEAVNPNIVFIEASVAALMAAKAGGGKPPKKKKVKP